MPDQWSKNNFKQLKKRCRSCRTCVGVVCPERRLSLGAVVAQQAAEVLHRGNVLRVELQHPSEHLLGELAVAFFVVPGSEWAGWQDIEEEEEAEEKRREDREDRADREDEGDVFM